MPRKKKPGVGIPIKDIRQQKATAVAKTAKAFVAKINAAETALAVQVAKLKVAQSAKAEPTSSSNWFVRTWAALIQAVFALFKPRAPAPEASVKEAPVAPVHLDLTDTASVHSHESEAPHSPAHSEGGPEQRYGSLSDDDSEGGAENPEPNNSDDSDGSESMHK